MSAAKRYAMLSALVLALASATSRAQNIEPPRAANAWTGPRLRLRMGAAARPLVGLSPVGLHTPGDGSWVSIDVVPGLQFTERFTVELGVNAMVPLADQWGLATFRLALTPAANWDLGLVYLRVGVPVMVSDAVRSGLQVAAGVVIAQRFYVGVVGDGMLPDLVAGVGVEMGVRFDPWRLRAVR